MRLYKNSFKKGKVYGNHLLEVTVSHDKKIKLPSLPMHSNRFSYSIRENPPALGQHTREILQDIGISDTDVQQLVDEGIVGG